MWLMMRRLELKFPAAFWRDSQVLQFKEVDLEFMFLNHFPFKDGKILNVMVLNVLGLKICFPSEKEFVWKLYNAHLTCQNISLKTSMNVLNP